MTPDEFESEILGMKKEASHRGDQLDKIQTMTTRIEGALLGDKFHPKGIVQKVHDNWALGNQLAKQNEASIKDTRELKEDVVVLQDEMKSVKAWRLRLTGIITVCISLLVYFKKGVSNLLGID
jgi:hypothetical protein